MPDEVLSPIHQSQGCDPADRAFVLSRKSSAQSSPLELTLEAAPDPPPVDPAFVVKKRGDTSPRLKIDGQPIALGSVFLGVASRL
jgi:hypothetical protein